MSDPSGDADHDPGRDTTDDLAGRIPGVTDALLHRGVDLDGRTGVDLVDVGLHEPLEVEAGDGEPRADSHEEAGDQVRHRDRRTEQSPEQDERDLVDHRRRDQEGEGHPERHAGFDEADEERHRRAGAERRDHPEQGGPGGACHDVAAGQRPPDPVRRDERAQEAHQRDDPDQQQHDLGQVEEEERERGTEALARIEPQDVGREPLDGRREQDPGDEPGGDASPDHEPERRMDTAQRQRRHPMIAASASRARAMPASSRS